MSRDPGLYLRDILEAIAKVSAYTRGLSQETFETSGMAYDAVLRNLELIGEAAKHLPQDLQDAAPDVPWRMIGGFRDHLAHAYFGLDNDTVWEVITVELPALATEAERLLRSRPRPPE